MNNPDKSIEKEYDLSSLGKGVRGKYIEQYQKGTNVVVIDPDLSKAFPNAKAVNDALRNVLKTQKKSGDINALMYERFQRIKAGKPDNPIVTES